MDKGFKMSARRGRSGAWKGVGGVFGVFVNPHPSCESKYMGGRWNGVDFGE